MLNLSLISLTSFILIYQNIIILNEETLILICFVTFCFIIFNKLSKTLYTNFTTRSLKTKSSLVTSLNQLTTTLIHIIKLQIEFKNLTNQFKNLKIYFLKLGISVSNNLPIYCINKSKIIYPKKIRFIQNLEQQIAKLLALLLIQKLTKLVKIQQFCKQNLKINWFLCFHKISLREHLNKLKNN
uniref:ATP synthase F0 subunit b n=1 Tax=Sarcopeltis skottsbergii TaxID=2765380 RepID=A0A7M1VM04_SARSK|nr:ATP synthase F0 subunit b [Sarcopeltis skottsbergii]QOS04462.1 ATP synthase F0 subunit b [Sarcopeltis skottsbergii]